MKQSLHQRPLFWLNLPEVPYEQARDLQKEWVVRKQLEESPFPDGLILLEHPPVVTLGKWGKEENLRVSSDYLKEQGITLIRCERGGDITYHGPGQLVGYPILDLKKLNLGVKEYVSRIEEVLIRALRECAVAAARREGFPGVWAGAKKIASIGIAVRKGIAFHGFALNYACNLAHFDLITPCGLKGVKMTSVREVTGKPVESDLLRYHLAFHFAQIFEIELDPIEVETLCRLLSINDDRFTKSLQPIDRSGIPRGIKPYAERAIPFTPTPAGRQALPSLRGRAREGGFSSVPYLKKPPWLKKPIVAGGSFNRVEGLVEKAGLHTVCREALCPNQRECFSRGTATFLLMGDRCTRRCTFCAVAAGPPRPLNPKEPQETARAVKAMDLTYAVLTSVTRDDLPDGGAGHFSRTITAIRRLCPQTKVECLIPDFQGSEPALQHLAQSRPSVINHNLETVERLYPAVRPAALYRRSLELLRCLNRSFPEILTKSGIMVGLGETREEITAAMKDLQEQGCRMLTIGQYLQPSRSHHPVRRYVTHDEFLELREEALAMGFSAAASGPFVRSSYHAEGLYSEALKRMAFHSASANTIVVADDNRV